jgi:RNA polymerase sigma factor (sigma-70 family)
MNPYTPLTDDQLMESVRRSDLHALGEIYVRYREDMPSVIRGLALDKKAFNDAEDILHDTFSVITKCADDYRIPGTLGGWLRGIAINQSLQWFRKRKTRKEQTFYFMDGDEAVFIDLPDPRSLMPTPKEEMNTDLMPQVYVVLSTLTPKLRQAVELVYFKGFSNQAAAGITGLTGSAMTWRVRQALQQIRQALNITACKYQPSKRQMWARNRNRNADERRRKDRERKRGMYQRKKAFAACNKANEAIPGVGQKRPVRKEAAA